MFLRLNQRPSRALLFWVNPFAFAGSRAISLLVSCFLGQPKRSEPVRFHLNSVGLSLSIRSRLVGDLIVLVLLAKLGFSPCSGILCMLRHLALRCSERTGLVSGVWVRSACLQARAFRKLRAAKVRNTTISQAQISL